MGNTGHPNLGRSRRQCLAVSNPSVYWEGDNFEIRLPIGRAKLLSSGSRKSRLRLYQEAGLTSGETLPYFYASIGVAKTLESRTRSKKPRIDMPDYAPL